MRSHSINRILEERFDCVIQTEEWWRIDVGTRGDGDVALSLVGGRRRQWARREPGTGSAVVVDGGPEVVVVVVAVVVVLGDIDAGAVVGFMNDGTSSIDQRPPVKVNSRSVRFDGIQGTRVNPPTCRCSRRWTPWN